MICLTEEQYELNFVNTEYGPAMLHESVVLDRTYGAGAALAYHQWCEEQNHLIEAADVNDAREEAGLPRLSIEELIAEGVVG